MPARLLLVPLTLLALVLAGCSGEDRPLPPPLEVYEDGRAEVLARADSGRALLVEHEPLDSVMTAPMVMELRLKDPSRAEGIQPGDKIRFDLVLDQDYRLDNVEKLPPSTRLRLTADSAATDSAGPDTAGADPAAALSGDSS